MGFNSGFKGLNKPDVEKKSTEDGGKIVIRNTTLLLLSEYCSAC